MKSIVWVNGQYKEDERLFDSDYEAYEWADGLLPDIAPYFPNVGYATPDEKVIKQLEDLLPQWAENNDVNVKVFKEKTLRDGKVIYKIWTEPQ